MSKHFTYLAIALSLVIAGAGTVTAGQRSAADQALYERAMRDCRSPKWPDGARPLINYAGGWYRCVEPKRG